MGARTQTRDTPAIGSGSIVAELAGGELGDARLAQRRDRVVAALEAHPDASFPEACASDAEVEALYRFLRNPRVTWAGLLAPHVTATRARCAALGTVLVLHDTTDLVFPGEASRTGLTRLGPARHGFWLHTALAVAATDDHTPLGLVHLAPFVRPVRAPDAAPKRDRVRFQDPGKESRYWRAGVTAVQAGLAADTRVLHVMDREADSYESLAAWVDADARFVVRATHDRRVQHADGTRGALAAAVAHAPIVCTRDVVLAPRRDGTRTLSVRTRHPARETRRATLQVAAAAVTVCRPRDVAATAPAGLPLHVVTVTEADAPAGTEPITWRLLTTEPIATRAQIESIVDAYRARWLIEEFFKALKTGCAYEQRQLERYHTLLVALALLAPIAWRLLLLRHLAREDAADAPATAVLTVAQLQLLRALPQGHALAPQPTVRAVLRVLARLGGHLRQNGPPGWLVLGRGFRNFCAIERGWIAAKEAAEK